MADLTVAMVKQFSANLYQLAQQQGSRLRECVTVEELTGEKKFFDRIGTTEAIEKTGIYDDTPIIPVPFTRRMCVPKDYHWGDLIDNLQKLKTLTDPAADTTQTGCYALGRKIDQSIINCATGTAYGGKEGTDAIVLPATQKVAITVGNGGSGNVGLNIAKLIAAKSIFGKRDIDLDDPRNVLFMAVSQSQLDDLLAITEVKSADYNTVKALVEGKVDTYMGFKFKRLEMLTKTDTGSNTNTRTCFAWVKSGIKIALPQDIKTRVGEDPGKCFNTRIYAELSVASCRIEDEKVVEVSCEEAD